MKESSVLRSRTKNGTDELACPIKDYISKRTNKRTIEYKVACRFERFFSE